MHYIHIMKIKYNISEKFSQLTGKFTDEFEVFLEGEFESENEYQILDRILEEFNKEFGLDDLEVTSIPKLSEKYKISLEISK